MAWLERAPQPLQLRPDCLRSVGDRLPKGHYKLQVSLSLFYSRSLGLDLTVSFGRAAIATALSAAASQRVHYKLHVSLSLSKGLSLSLSIYLSLRGSLLQCVTLEGPFRVSTPKGLSLCVSLCCTHTQGRCLSGCFSARVLSYTYVFLPQDHSQATAWVSIVGCRGESRGKSNRATLPGQGSILLAHA